MEVILVNPISFTEPTCLLVSTETRSSGIINKLVPRALPSLADFPWDRTQALPKGDIMKLTLMWFLQPSDSHNTAKWSGKPDPYDSLWAGVKFSWAYVISAFLKVAMKERELSERSYFWTEEKDVKAWISGSYDHNSSSCENSAWKNSGLMRTRTPAKTEDAKRTNYISHSHSLYSARCQSCTFFWRRLFSEIRRGKPKFSCAIWIEGVECTSRPRGVLPLMAYTGRLRPKGLPFSLFRYIKGKGFQRLRYIKG